MTSHYYNIVLPNDITFFENCPCYRDDYDIYGYEDDYLNSTRMRKTTLEEMKLSTQLQYNIIFGKMIPYEEIHSIFEEIFQPEHKLADLLYLEKVYHLYIDGRPEERILNAMEFENLALMQYCVHENHFYTEWFNLSHAEQNIRRDSNRERRVRLTEYYEIFREFYKKYNFSF